MKIALGFALLFSFVLAAEARRASAEARAANKLLDTAAAVLSGAREPLFYSLEPSGDTEPGQPQLHEVKILGQARLDEKQTAAVVQALKSAIANWDGITAMCFDPRHALRVTANNHTYDFLLCYECQQLEVYEDTKRLLRLFERTPERSEACAAEAEKKALGPLSEHHGHG